MGTHQASETPEARAERYRAEFQIAPEAALILAQRFVDITRARRFVHPSVHDLEGYADMPDIERACEMLINAVRRGEGVLIYGHDDPDGFASAAILHDALRDINPGSRASIFAYPLQRAVDGYIINPEVLKRYQAMGVNLVVTVDFGVSSRENYEIPGSLGMQCVICDHHETRCEQFPVPVVDPKRPGATYPFRDLAGVGVTFKLVAALYQRVFDLSLTELCRLHPDMLAAAMVGTIADRVRPTDENRTLIMTGLERANGIDRPWAVLGRRNGTIDVPRVLGDMVPLLLAAAVRDPVLGLHFFLESDIRALDEMVPLLRSAVEERRRTINQLFERAIKAVEIRGDIAISKLAVEKAHSLGPVAARLRDHFQRTTLVLGLIGDRCVGEMRTTGHDLFEMLSTAQELFTDYGGHQRAAGFSMPQANLEQVCERLASYAAANPLPVPKAPQAEAELSRRRISVLQAFLPFGEGNPAPVLRDPEGLFTTNNSLDIIALANG